MSSFTPSAVCTALMPWLNAAPSKSASMTPADPRDPTERRPAPAGQLGHVPERATLGGDPRQDLDGATLPPPRRRTVKRPGSRVEPGRNESSHKRATALLASTCHRAASQARLPTCPPGCP